MQKIDAKLRRMEDRIKVLDAKLDVLVAQTKESGVEAKADLRKRIDEIRARREAVKSRLNDLKATGSDKWYHFKSGLGVAWKDVESAFKELVK